jgi:hypothetical protein
MVDATVATFLQNISREWMSSRRFVCNPQSKVWQADLNRDDFVTNRQLCSVLGTNVLTEYHRMRAEDKSSSKLNKEWRQEC